MRGRSGHERDPFSSSYFHFRDRVKERYNININFNQYLTLCQIPVAKIKEPLKGRKIGWLEIDNVKVLVVKEVNGKKRLITALIHTA